jgi:4-alpha-glucanotransferase
MRFSRRSGVLLHITSLPSPYGIGDLGEDAYRFADFLESSGQKLWQVLPLGPTGYENSPYSSPSAFAGNCLMVSPAELVEDGLISRKDLSSVRDLPLDRIDFARVIKLKREILDSARKTYISDSGGKERREFADFCDENCGWLDDYAFFMALKISFHQLPWYSWPEKIAFRKPAAMREYRTRLSDSIAAAKFDQFLFFRQWRNLRRYANRKGIGIVCDIPIFVNQDSVDVWANRRHFLLDKKGWRTALSGVPPSRSGISQIWDMPLYNWKAMEEDGYQWWKFRFEAVLKDVDIIRVDHFSGFYALWHIKVGAKTSADGKWVPGPGADFFRKMESELGPLPIIGEALEPRIKKEANALLAEFGYPGIRILQHGFQGGSHNPHLPKNYSKNCVAYPGTHDDNTILGWYRSLSPKSRKLVRGSLGIAGGRAVNWQIIRVMEESRANTVLILLQDILGLGSEARMNIPGTNSGQWEWRFDRKMLTGRMAARLLELTGDSGR